jgi:hypothetical protein
MASLKKVFALLLLTVAAFAQGPSGTPVIVSDGPPVEFYTKYVFVSGTATYVCNAKHYNTETSVTFSAISNAASAVITATGHGFHLDSSPTVTFAGGTGNWAALNGTRKITVIDDNSFSVAVNSSAFGAVAGTITIKTNAPRLTSGIWVVTKSVDDSSTSGRISLMTAVGGYRNVCDSTRTALSFQ